MLNDRCPLVVLASRSDGGWLEETIGRDGDHALGLTWHDGKATVLLGRPRGDDVDGWLQLILATREAGRWTEEILPRVQGAQLLAGGDRLAVLGDCDGDGPCVATRGPSGTWTAQGLDDEETRRAHGAIDRAGRIHVCGWTGRDPLELHGRYVSETDDGWLTEDVDGCGKMAFDAENRPHIAFLWPIVVPDFGETFEMVRSDAGWTSRMIARATFDPKGFVLTSDGDDVLVDNLWVLTVDDAGSRLESILPERLPWKDRPVALALAGDRLHVALWVEERGVLYATRAPAMGVDNDCDGGATCPEPCSIEPFEYEDPQPEEPT